MLTANQVADWFLVKAKEDNVTDVGNMKLNKLVYFAHANMLAATGQPLVTDESAEAWQHGPVFRSVYFSHKGESSTPDDLDVESTDFDQITLEMLTNVWHIYSPYTASQLRNMSHDVVWRKSYMKGTDGIIPDDTVRDYFHQKTYVLSSFTDFISVKEESLLDLAEEDQAVEDYVAYLTA